MAEELFSRSEKFGIGTVGGTAGAIEESVTARYEAQLATLNRRIDQQKLIIDQQKTTILALREKCRRAGIDV